MKKATINLTTDFLSAFLFLAMTLTGFILWFPLPPGTNKTLKLWNLTRHEWGAVHAWISGVLLLSLLLHLALHWKWVVSIVIKKLFDSENQRHSRIKSGIVTAGTLSVILTLFAWVAFSNVDEIKPEGKGYCASDSSISLLNPVKTANRSLQQEKLDFKKDIYPIFEQSCLSCHGPRKQLGGFRVDQRNNFFTVKNGTPLVVAGKSTESSLIDIVSGQRKDMKSAESHVLLSNEISLLKNWIDDGAVWPDNFPVQK